MKKNILLFILYIILVVSFTNLMEIAYYSFIANQHYNFEIITGLAIPLVVALVSGFLLFFTGKNNKKSKENDSKDINKAAVTENDDTADNNTDE